MVWFPARHKRSDSGWFWILQFKPQGVKSSHKSQESMPAFPFSFRPLPEKLYAPDDLFKGFDELSASSYGETVDFRIYQEFVSSGRFAPRDYFMAMMQSLHDDAMRGLTQEFLEKASLKAVAVMGGHDLRRDSAVYENVARLARELAQRGFTLVSGGGPGAMEATHLGALLQNATGETLAEAIKELKKYPALPPKLRDIVKNDGSFDSSLVEQAHAWFLPAYRVFKRIIQEVRPGQSLAIPTWLYGHEPTTPLALTIAKYFQNSIREDRLLAIATHGVIYVEGRAGTVQEIFQDANQNYYRTSGSFSPMILFGADYWSKTIPAIPVLNSLFSDADYKKYVLATDSSAEVIRFLGEQKEVERPAQRMSRVTHA